MRIIPYLFLPGNSEEAMHLYKDALNGEISVLQRYSDGPPDMEVPEGMSDKVMHGRVAFDGGHVYVSDAHGEVGAMAHSLTIEFDDVEQLNKAYQLLSNKGTVHYELQDTFWGARYGKLTDRFGIHWDLNFQYPKQAK